ncbi:uncharacterized protein LOC131933111 isoform X2 [Physella acuta]|uniref:uncharacterized protein LOC131933111 isoform X2 n=1 Tax=Physella acuta TaxID=109671 RepID=UPI0027DBFA57|nr:uncharacterized protein LOC131933111 isoform X2 [Physella acuta]
MYSIIYASLVCLLFAADSFAISNNDTVFITDVKNDLFGKCYSKCQTIREELKVATDKTVQCSKADEYTKCLKTDDNCVKNTEANQLDTLNTDVQKFCESITPAAAESTTKTTPTTTTATTAPTTPDPAIANPANPLARRRRAADIKAAVDELLKKTETCSKELCLTDQSAMISTDGATIDCTLFGKYGKCLVEACPSLKSTFNKYNAKCGAANIQLFSYALFMAGLLFKILV